MYLSLSTVPLPPPCVPGALLTVHGARLCRSAGSRKAYLKALPSTRLTVTGLGRFPGGHPCPLTCRGAPPLPLHARALPAHPPHVPTEAPTCLAVLASAPPDSAGDPRSVQLHARVRAVQCLDLRLTPLQRARAGSATGEGSTGRPLAVSCKVLLEDGSGVAECWAEGEVAWELLGMGPLAAQLAGACGRAVDAAARARDGDGWAKGRAYGCPAPLSPVSRPSPFDH